MKPNIELRDFHRLHICAGRITFAETISSGKKSAYLVRVELGPTWGERWSVVQVVDDYALDQIIGRAVVALVNIAQKRVFGHESQILILGVRTEDGGVSLLDPSNLAAVGAEVF